MANKKNNKNGIQVHPKQGFFRRNLLKIIAGASLILGGAGLAYYFNKDNSTHQAQADNKAVTLETLEKNENYFPFDKHVGELKYFPGEIEEFARACRENKREPNLAKDVSVIFEKQVSLLPNTPNFQGLEQKLNEELAEFEKALPQEILKKPHRVILLSQDKTLENLPIERDKVKQIYLINSMAEKVAFEGTYENEQFTLSTIRKSVVGEAAFNFTLNKTKAGLEFDSMPIKMYISPTLGVQSELRYPALLHTTLSEYLHSVCTDIKSKNLQKLMLYFHEKDKLNKFSAATKIINDVVMLDEGVIHASVMLYMERTGKYPNALEFERNKFAKQLRYKKVNEFYDAINSEIAPGVRIDSSSKLIPLLNLWNNGHVGTLYQGKDEIVRWMKEKVQNKQPKSK